MHDNPKGYFKNLLAIDCETTGVNYETDDPSVGNQAVSWGLIVADGTTLEPIEELYVEIKWNDISKASRKADPEWGKGATKIHGLTYEHLENNGVTEEEAVIQIVNLIIKYWGPTTQIKFLAHNVNFDICFIRAMCRRHDIELPIGGRNYDSNSIGFGTIGSYTSDQLFETVGYNTRDSHNALEDTRMALGSCRRIKKLINKIIME